MFGFTKEWFCHVKSNVFLFCNYYENRLTLPLHTQYLNFFQTICFSMLKKIIGLKQFGEKLVFEIIVTYSIIVTPGATRAPEQSSLVSKLK